MSAPPGLPVTFASPDMWLSEFRLAPDHPRWAGSGATTDSVALIAFPRTSVGITQEGRREIVADPLSAVAYSPGQAYRRRLITAVGDDCTVLAIDPQLVAEAARPFDARSADAQTYRFPFTAVPLGRAEFMTVHELRHAFTRAGETSADAVREELYWLFDRVVAAGYGQPRAGVRAARLATHRAHAELTEGLRERLGRDLSVSLHLDELAGAAFVSPFHLARIFRGATGVPIHAYRTELRLRASLALIADGVRLADVAQQLGFASHAHLTQMFKRAYGSSPAEWRANLHRRLREKSKNMEAPFERSLIA